MIKREKLGLNKPGLLSVSLKSGKGKKKLKMIHSSQGSLAVSDLSRKMAAVCRNYYE